MVIVTTFHIDRAQDLIINNVNSARDVILNQLHILLAELQTIYASLNSFCDARDLIPNRLQILLTELRTVNANVNDLRSTARTSSQVIQDQLRSSTNPTRAAIIASNAPAIELPQPSIEDFRRTFFSNAGLAIDATRALLGYVPPARYDIPPATLPLDELYGQLHALHQNSLEWLTHINHNIDSILNFLNPSSLFSQGTPLSRLRDAVTSLTSKVDNIYSTLQSPQPTSDQPGSSRRHTRLEEIEHSLDMLHRKIDNITSSIKSSPSQPCAGPGPITPPSTATSKDLPIYQAVHPNTSCRTYGTILFDGTSSRIPMDIVGRPVSTALRLELSVAPMDQTTSVTYKIFDDGYLLLSDDIETAHRLQHYPSDCLALLHQKCPNFIYKIKGHGLC
nr:serine-rich protein [Garlic virus A]UUQ75098.1 serine-rich protein [Garlic virus A]